MNRREFGRGMIAATGLSLVNRAVRGERGRPPRILLRSSWQMVNIGDIAHTPGVLALLERYLPEAEVRLWASSSHSAEVAAMEQRRFPKLQIVKGSLREDGTATTAELGEALSWTDFLLHGSGPSLVAARDVAAFDRHIGKPFGVYGITYSGAEEWQRGLMSRAAFLFFRDSVSLAQARTDGIECPVMEFGPDGAFACDLRDEAAANAFLQAQGLEPGRFVCCIPRLRYTPYWRIDERRPRDPARQARNDAIQEQDHVPLRETIATIVRESGMRVLLCPEDMTQMRVGRELLWDRLPADVAKHVVWREQFWRTDEAVSTYVRSAGLFGLEMHSPILCIGNGVPAIVCRFAEQTSKGFMWQDIGLADWLFDMDRPEDVARLTPTVMTMITDRDAALERVARAQERVTRRQQETMSLLRDMLG